MFLPCCCRSASGDHGSLHGAGRSEAPRLSPRRRPQRCGDLENSSSCAMSPETRGCMPCVVRDAQPLESGCPQGERRTAISAARASTRCLSRWAIGFRDGLSVQRRIAVGWSRVTDVSDTRTGDVSSLSGPRIKAMTGAVSRLSQRRPRSRSTDQRRVGRAVDRQSANRPQHSRLRPMFANDHQ